MRARQLEAGDRQAPTYAARTENDLVGPQPQASRSLDGVLIDEACGAGLLIHLHTQGIDLLAQRGMRTHITHNVAHAPKQPAIVKLRCAYLDAIFRQLPSLAH